MHIRSPTAAGDIMDDLWREAVELNALDTLPLESAPLPFDSALPLALPLDSALPQALPHTEDAATEPAKKRHCAEASMQ
jgi:hypothetical protein